MLGLTCRVCFSFVGGGGSAAVRKLELRGRDKRKTNLFHHGSVVELAARKEKPKRSFSG